MSYINRYKKTAQELFEMGELEAAGKYYIAASNGSLMEFRRLPKKEENKFDNPSPRLQRFGSAMKYLLLGSLCFRLADQPARSRNHAKQGELCVENVLDEGVYSTNAQIGFCQELIGDFRLIGDYSNYEDSYKKAATQYEMVDNQLGWSLEPDIEESIIVTMELADSVGVDISEDERNEIMYESLETRIEFKRGNYPKIIDSVIEAGTWSSDLL